MNKAVYVVEFNCGNPECVHPGMAVCRWCQKILRSFTDDHVFTSKQSTLGRKKKVVAFVEEYLNNGTLGH